MLMWGRVTSVDVKACEFGTLFLSRDASGHEILYCGGICFCVVLVWETGYWAESLATHSAGSYCEPLVPFNPDQ